MDRPKTEFSNFALFGGDLCRLVIGRPISNTKTNNYLKFGEKFYSAETVGFSLSSVFCLVFILSVTGNEAVVCSDI
jgi:hypothetical protein